jgi:hypothetical protein
VVVRPAGGGKLGPVCGEEMTPLEVIRAEAITVADGYKFPQGQCVRTILLALADDEELLALAASVPLTGSRVK